MSSNKKAGVNKFKVVLGYTFLFISIVLLVSFISYMFNWRADQSNISSLYDRDVEVENILGKIGASVSHFFIFKLFGIGSFVCIPTNKIYTIFKSCSDGKLIPSFFFILQAFQSG